MPENFQTVSGAAAVGAEMATLTAWVNDGKGGVTQGKLRVEPDQLPTVKATWVQARDKFVEMQHTARALQNIPYPAEDQVSKQAVNNLRKAAGQGQGCLAKTLDDCIARCEELISQTDKAMHLYSVADTSAEIKFNL